MKHSSEITVFGRLGSEPVLRTSAAGRPWIYFRLVSTPRYRGEDGQFRDGASQWFSVKAWDDLARNSGFSLHQGMSVVVQGRVGVETWTGEEGMKVSHVLRADAIAVELGLGMANFVRTAPTRAAVEEGGGTVTGPDGSRWESVDLPAEEGEAPDDGDRAVPADVPGDVPADVPEDGPADDDLGVADLDGEADTAGSLSASGGTR